MNEPQLTAEELQLLNSFKHKKPATHEEKWRALMSRIVVEAINGPDRETEAETPRFEDTLMAARCSAEASEVEFVEVPSAFQTVATKLRDGAYAAGAKDTLDALEAFWCVPRIPATPIEAWVEARRAHDPQHRPSAPQMRFTMTVRADAPAHVFGRAHELDAKDAYAAGRIAALADIRTWWSDTMKHVAERGSDRVRTNVADNRLAAYVVEETERLQAGRVKRANAWKPCPAEPYRPAEIEHPNLSTREQRVRYALTNACRRIDEVALQTGASVRAEWLDLVALLQQEQDAWARIHSLGDEIGVATQILKTAAVSAATFATQTGQKPAPKKETR